MSISKKVRLFLAELGSYLQNNASPRELAQKPPEELHIELTYRCNATCVMCNLRYLEGKEITLVDMKQIVNESDLLKDIKYIVLSGGEPLLNADFMDILIFLHAKYKDATILILSNLIDTEIVISRLEQIKETMGFSRISIGTSLDGINDVHDHIRGVDGAFKSLIETSLVMRKKYPQIFPSFNFTLIPENSNQLYDVYKFAKKMNFNMSFQLLVQKKESELLAWSEKDFINIDNGINMIIEDVYKEKKWKEFTGEMLFDDLSTLFFLLNLHYISKYLKNPERFLPNCPCGEKYAMIDPLKRVYFCPVHKELIAGNLNNANFDDIWNSGNAGSARAFFNEKKCHCWLSCTNSVMLADAFFTNKDQIMRKFINSESG